MIDNPQDGLDRDTDEAADWKGYEMEDEESEDGPDFGQLIIELCDEGGRITSQDALDFALLCLRHWADDQGIVYAGAEARSFNQYMRDLAEDSGGAGAAHSSRYTGWDRIHDDNKAEGRPVGNQWSDDGVRYVGGVKVTDR